MIVILVLSYFEQLNLLVGFILILESVWIRKFGGKARILLV